MNWFDLVIFGILLVSIIISFFRGILREILSLVIWILAFVLAFRFAETLGALLHDVVGNKTVSYVLGFIIIFALVFFAGMILNFFVKNVIDKIGFGPVDHALGFCFGAVRGLLVITVLLMFISVSPMQKSDWYQQSKITPYFSTAVTWLRHFVPQQIQHFSNWIGYPYQPKEQDYVRNHRDSLQSAR